METLEVKIINPKAAILLKGLEDLKLISIKNVEKELLSVIKKQKSKPVPRATKDAVPDTYPFKPQYLTFNGVNYILREKLNAVVSFEDGNYIISNELLDITVWGKTRDEAEEAFSFTFHSLYENFAKEQDKHLSARSLKLKQTLKKLIVNQK